MRFPNLAGDLKRSSTHDETQPGDYQTSPTEPAEGNSQDELRFQSDLKTTANLVVRSGQMANDITANTKASVPPEFQATLWLNAYDSLPPSETKYLPIQSLDSQEIFKNFLDEVNTKKAEMQKRQWTIVRKTGERVPLRRFIDNIAQYLKKFQDIGDVAIQYDPGHAALPWAAVRALLQLAISDSQMYGSMLEGLEYTSNVIVTYSQIAVATLGVPFTAADQLEANLVRLYAAVLRYLNKAYQYYSQHTPGRLIRSAFSIPTTSIEALIQSIKKEEERVFKVLTLLQTENMKSGIENAISSLASGIRSIHDVVISPPMSIEEERYEVLKWLDPVYTDDDFDNAVRKRLDGTCDWCITSSIFQDWCAPTLLDKGGPPKVLWIHSPPAFGKTILSSRLLQYLIETKTSAVAFFYCVSADEAKKKPYAILRSWIAQIVKQSDDSLHAVSDLFKQHQERPPTISELWTLFKLATAAVLPGLVLAIDGFDECSTIEQTAKFQTEDTRAQFLQELLQNVQRNTRILLTSRDLPSFRSELSSAAEAGQVELTEYRITPSDNQEDIRNVSRKLIGSKLANKTPELRDEIVNKAAENSRGMFLMINLFGSSLKPSKKAKALLAAVEEMPAGIDSAYERDLDHLKTLDHEEQSRVTLMLRLVLFAMRPMTVRELIEAIAVGMDPSETYPHDFLPDSWEEADMDRSEVAELILEPCASFLELRQPNSGGGLDSATVLFTHFSVKEFLLKQPMATGYTDAVQYKGHEWLALLCLRYLQYDLFMDFNGQFASSRTDSTYVRTDLRRIYPFYEYAALNWTTHAAELTATSSEMLELAVKLFEESSRPWILWRDYTLGTPDVLDLEKWFDEESQNLPKYQRTPQYVKEKGRQLTRSSAMHASPLYVAASYGLTDLAGSLHQTGQGLETEGGQLGYPLQAAVFNGRLETVKYLTDHGADVNRSGELYVSALHAASFKGFEGLVQSLLSLGADVQAMSPGGRTPLHFACHSGSTITVQQLLRNGALFDHASRTGESPIARACASGHLDIVKVLLSKYEDHIPRHQGGWDLLRIALSHQRYDVAEYLVGQGANVNFDQSSKTQFCPLHVAAATAPPSLVELILRCGGVASINKAETAETGWTPLALALCYNQKPIEVAEALLNYGADVAHHDSAGNTLLHLVVSRIGSPQPLERWNKVLEFCIARGADVNAQDNKGMTPLITMTVNSEPFLEPLRILIAAGADVGSGERSAGCSSIMSLICSTLSPSDWASQVEELLQHGADINYQSETFPSPLHLAVSANKPDIKKVEMLLNWRANVNLIWKDDSVLIYAVEAGDLGVVKEILGRGVDLEYCNSWGITALLAAIERGNIEITRCLLDAGASMKAPRHRSFDALSMALHTRSKNCDLFEILIRQTEDVRSFDTEGDNALTEMLGYRKQGEYTDFANVMIDHGFFLPKRPKTKTDPRRAFSTEVLQLHKHAFHGRSEDFTLLYDQEKPKDHAEFTDSLLLAASAGSAPSIVKTLLDDDANLECATLSGRTPLQLSVTSGHFDVFMTLLQHGANVHTTDMVGTTALQQAARSHGQSAAIIHALIDHGALASRDQLCKNDDVWEMLQGEWIGETRTQDTGRGGFTSPFRVRILSTGTTSDTRLRRFEGSAEDEFGEAALLGQVLEDNKLHFVMVREDNEGANCFADFDNVRKAIEGAWGISSTIVDGHFSLRKASLNNDAVHQAAQDKRT